MLIMLAIFDSYTGIILDTFVTLLFAQNHARSSSLMLTQKFGLIYL